MSGAPIDAITLQVINGALQTIAEEMGHVLYRMSFSSIIRESQDLGAGLFDTDFNTLCESESTSDTQTRRFRQVRPHRDSRY